MAVIPRRNEKTKVLQNLGGAGGGGDKVHYGRCASDVWRIVRLV